MQIGVQADPRDAIESHSERLVQRTLGIAGTIALPNVGVDPDVLHGFYPGSHAESLEEIFVEQPSAIQLGVKRRDVPEVSVVHVEFKPGMRLNADRKKITAQTWSGRGDNLIATRAVRLKRIVDRDIPLVGDRIFKEHKGPGDLPLQGVDSETGSAGVMQVVVARSEERRLGKECIGRWSWQH